MSVVASPRSVAGERCVAVVVGPSSRRRISDQLGHAKVSVTQDRYLGRRLTDRQTADVLEALFDGGEDGKHRRTAP
jgi:integrase